MRHIEYRQFNINIKKEKGDSNMSEKLLTNDALDERDFLRKKINRGIEKGRFVGSKRIKDKKVEAVPVADFTKDVVSDYQSVTDMIRRYQALDVAIIQANAMTKITTRSGREMTRAEAIALRRSLNSGIMGRPGELDFMGQLIGKMEQQYAQATTAVQNYNQKADAELENYKTSFAGRDNSKTLNDEEIAAIEKLTADLYGELVDPIGIKDKLDALREEHDTLAKELDSAIKISNATTYVEF